MDRRRSLIVALFAALIGCGHYYHGYYPGAVALDAPTVIVGGESIVVGSVITGTASGTWTAQNGWSGGTVVGGITADATCSVPRIAAIAGVTGNGVGLPGLVGPGIHVACGACSNPVSADGTAQVTTSGNDAIAALSLLGSLSSLSLGGDAAFVTCDGARLEASCAHDALPHDGGASAVVVRAIGGPPPAIPAPVRVHLVIDASASMETRWDEVRDAAIALVGRLRAQDELEIVVYATDARVALAPAPVGNGDAARNVIRGLSCSGQTNIEAGLRAAYRDLAPDGGSIVLLLSDGVPDGGYATPAELSALAGDARARTSATTITIGLGSEFHPGILRAIARRGGGDFRIAPTAHELDALLEAELTLHANIVARDVSFDLDLASGVSIAASFDASSVDAIVTVSGAHVSIRLGTLSANEARTIVLPVQVTAPGPVATVNGHATSNGAIAAGQRAIAVREGRQSIPAGGLAASLDADLASALVHAASFVENGDAGQAAAAIRAHAELARQVASGDPAIGARVDHALAFAIGLEAQVPSASWGARRQAASAMLEWSVGLSR
jgi:Ca-activated chloride channel family protein